MSYRFLLTPRWILFHLLVIAAIVLMVNLSLWQWHRLDERKDFNALVESRIDSDPVRLESIVPVGSGDEVGPAVEWRNAQAEGEYLPAEQWLVVNRSQGGAAGSNVVTAMRLDDGRVLLVTRGFIPLGEPVPTAPAGRMKVLGRVRESAPHRFGQISLSDETDDGQREIPRVDIPALQEEMAASGIEGEVVPVSLEALVSEPEDSAALAPVAEPERSEGSHLSYAIQWLIFAVCVAAGWVFAVRKSIRTRRLALANAGGGEPQT